jgi:hypothetical protein
MRIVVSLVFMLAFFTSQAQKPTDLDKSPMDMNYWPNNYPILKMNGKAKSMPIARVLYGRPMISGRTIFGNILKYDEVWRLGANEATEIEFFSNVKIAGKIIAKGRYTMYCIPHETRWTLIINRDNYSWGHFKYDSKKDVLRKDVDLEKTNDNIEAFTMYFDDTRTGANLVMVWDDLKAILPMSIAPSK